MYRPITLICLALLAGCADQVVDDAPVEQPTVAEEAPEAANYEISREIDAPFSFRFLGITLNEGSTLQREAILFNDPAAPAQLTSSKSSFEYRDRRFEIDAETKLKISQPLVALEVRHILFDVFGQHMRNLRNLEAKDIAVGEFEQEGTWRLFDDGVVDELLTRVTYVARARLTTGEQWVFNEEALTAALASLRLERIIGEDDRAEGE